MLYPERWRHVERLYHAALGRGEDDRASFMLEASAGDEALRREVESLLPYTDRAERFLEEPAIRTIRPAVTQPKTRARIERGPCSGR